MMDGLNGIKGEFGHHAIRIRFGNGDVRYVFFVQDQIDAILFFPQNLDLVEVDHV